MNKKQLLTVYILNTRLNAISNPLFTHSKYKYCNILKLRSSGDKLCANGQIRQISISHFQKQMDFEFNINHVGLFLSVLLE